jgi:1,4-dihydroxy-2-naphthoate octaprenyltransferase
MTGIILAHSSVNLFNEYSDWRTGIDTHTKRTAFSGGTGTLQAGELTPVSVRIASWLTLGTAFLIGLYLAYRSGWVVLALMAAGGIVTVTYTDYLARWMLGEASSGIALGSLVVIGAYYVQTGAVTPGIAWASIPPGLLTSALLYLNEFPDMEADRAGGRFHLVIALGRKRAAVGYAILLAAVYVSLAGGVVAGATPPTVLLGFISTPLAIAASYKALRYHDNMERLEPALGMNVAVVLATDFLMAAGYVLG